ncbi:hypothetical protein JCM8208_004169 [Rhodotorula glutinis]
MADAFQTNIALTAIQHVASTWLDTMLAAHPQAKQQVERCYDEWVAEMAPLAHAFAKWPSYQRKTFLELLNGILGACQREEGNDLPTHDEVFESLHDHWKSYAHLRWIGEEIIKDFSGHPGSVGSARRAHAAQQFFKQSVVAHVDKAEWDGEGDAAREAVIDELDGVRRTIEEGRSPVTGLRLANDGYELLPGLADSSRFPAFNAMLHRVDQRRRAAEAHAVTEALKQAGRAARGSASVDQDSHAVEKAIGELAWWMHKAERAQVVRAVGRALNELKAHGPPPDSAKKRNAIVAALNELRASAGYSAHSLAHRPAGRAELSARQQVVYARRYAGV